MSLPLSYTYNGILHAIGRFFFFHCFLISLRYSLYGFHFFLSLPFFDLSLNLILLLFIYYQTFFFLSRTSIWISFECNLLSSFSSIHLSLFCFGLWSLYSPTCVQWIKTSISFFILSVKKIKRIRLLTVVANSTSRLHKPSVNGAKPMRTALNVVNNTFDWNE